MDKELLSALNRSSIDLDELSKICDRLNTSESTRIDLDTFFTKITVEQARGISHCFMRLKNNVVFVPGEMLDAETRALIFQGICKFEGNVLKIAANNIGCTEEGTRDLGLLLREFKGQDLHFNWCGLNAVTFKYFVENLKYFTGKHLDIGSNIGGNEGANVIARMLSSYKGERLSLSQCGISTGVADIANAFTTDTTLSINLGYNNISENVGFLANYVKHMQGGSLELQYNNIGVDGAREICASWGEFKGKSLDLSGNKFEHSGSVQIVEYLKEKFAGEQVNLSQNYCGDAGVEAIANGFGNYSINLSDNLIGPQGAKYLGEQLHKFTGLVLDLSFNNIQAAGVAYLAKSWDKQKINLDISSNKIGAAGAKAIADVGVNFAGDLHLAHNNLGDQGAVSITNFFSRFAGGELDLSLNEIGDKGLEAIAEKLGDFNGKSLNLGGNSYKSFASMQKLADHLHEFKGETLNICSSYATYMPIISSLRDFAGKKLYLGRVNNEYLEDVLTSLCNRHRGLNSLEVFCGNDAITEICKKDIAMQEYKNAKMLTFMFCLKYHDIAHPIFDTEIPTLIFENLKP